MFSVNWVYGMWAEEFRCKLIGGIFKGAISFDKDTLFLQFVDNERNNFTIECKFIDGHLLSHLKVCLVAELNPNSLQRLECLY